MSGWLLGVWTVLVGLQVPQLILTYAPKSFWDELSDRNPHRAALLWGYSHMFGPRWRDR